MFIRLQVTSATYKLIEETTTSIAFAMITISQDLTSHYIDYAAEAETKCYRTRQPANLIKRYASTDERDSVLQYFIA